MKVFESSDEGIMSLFIHSYLKYKKDELNSNKYFNISAHDKVKLIITAANHITINKLYKKRSMRYPPYWYLLAGLIPFITAGIIYAITGFDSELLKSISAFAPIIVLYFEVRRVKRIDKIILKYKKSKYWGYF